MPVGCSSSDPEGLRDLRDAHADEITEFDDLGREGIFSGERLEGLIYRQHFSGRSLQFDPGFVKFLQLLIAPPLLARLATRLINQDAPHGLRCRSEKMRTATPLLPLRTGQPKPGFVNQSGSLQRLAR